MAKYLDPKADVTFKKVFGEHKNLVMSLLNAIHIQDKEHPLWWGVGLWYDLR